MEDKMQPYNFNHKIKIDKCLIEQALNDILIEKQVIVHCFLRAAKRNMPMRIGKFTYIRDQDSLHRSKIVTAYNICIYPHWKEVTGDTGAKFTLVFSGLPKSCNSFHLFEHVPQDGGFYSETIQRNKTDVYSIEIYA